MKSNSELVKIIIPIYKSNLSKSEIISLKRTFHILENYCFVIICPEGLNVHKIKEYGASNNVKFDYFAKKYFKSIEAYNKLMLSDFFYKKFLDTKFILICQTDVYVIKDDLLKWCNANYDYIGAPWIGTKQTRFRKNLNEIKNVFKKALNKKTKGYEHLFKVGNGGFSLRNTNKHFEVTHNHKTIINYYLSNKNPDNLHIEDVFFSFKANELIENFNIPDYKEALNFCIDRKPKIALEINNHKLPFAVHGFNKPKVYKFWKKMIPELK